MSWQDSYAVAGDPFGAFGPERTNPHRGTDFKGQWRGRGIPAYAHGVVALTGYSSVLGYYIVVRLDDGRYAGWAHTIRTSRLNVGTEVWAGTIIAQVAGSQDSPGSAWFGIHIHTTLGPDVDSIYTGTVYDPAPRIRAACNGSSPAGGGQTHLEDDMLTPEQDNMLRSVHAAIFTGGGDAGDEAIITRLVKLEQSAARTEPRIVNLDQQVTGADNFDAKVGPSVAGRLIAVQKAVTPK